MAWNSTLEISHVKKNMNVGLRNTIVSMLSHILKLNCIFAQDE